MAYRCDYCMEREARIVVDHDADYIVCEGCAREIMWTVWVENRWGRASYFYFKDYREALRFVNGPAHARGHKMGMIGPDGQDYDRCHGGCGHWYPDRELSYRVCEFCRNAEVDRIP